MLVSYSTNVRVKIPYIKGNINLILMHSHIVNGNQLLCIVVFELHKGTVGLFLFYFHPFLLFLLCVVVRTLTVFLLFWGAIIVFVYNLMRRGQQN